MAVLFCDFSEISQIWKKFHFFWYLPVTTQGKLVIL